MGRLNGKGPETSRVNPEKDSLDFIQKLLKLGFTPDEIIDALSRAVQILLKRG